MQEGLGGIRDVLIDGAQEIYINRFRKIETARREAQAANYFISSSPRYLIEFVGMILIAALAYWLSLRPGGLSAAIPVLGALAIGAQRLFPQMQQAYFGWAALSANASSLADVVALLDQPLPENFSTATPLHLEHSIGLRNVSFRYQSDSPEAIRQLSFLIPRGSRVGFIGETGSGKSTVIDLIMGLLKPTSGVIEIRRPTARCRQLRSLAGVYRACASVYLSGGCNNSPKHRLRPGCSPDRSRARAGSGIEGAAGRTLYKHCQNNIRPSSASGA